MDINNASDTFQVLTQHGTYELALVGAGVCLAGLTTLGWLHLKPWWEARTMRAEKEKELNHYVGKYLFQSFKDMVEGGDLSVDQAYTYVKRISNVVPDILPKGNLSLKEVLQEKHPSAKEEVTENKPTSLLARLSEAKKRVATA